MRTFFTQVLQINGKKIESAVDQYSSPDVKTMTDAASQAAIRATAVSGDKAVVAVSTEAGTIQHFEVEVTHQVTAAIKKIVRKCRSCGCTDLNCRQCIEKTGKPCSWVEFDLCSACRTSSEAP